MKGLNKIFIFENINFLLLFVRMEKTKIQTEQTKADTVYHTSSLVVEWSVAIALTRVQTPAGVMFFIFLKDMS